jgi:putative transposase
LNGDLLDAVFTALTVTIIKSPVRAPRANAIAEGFVGTIRRELLDRILIINQRHAAMALREYELYDNDHRSHRNLGQAAPLRPLSERTRTRINNVRRWDRLGGLLHVYQQVAWGVPSFGHPQSEKEIVGKIWVLASILANIYIAEDAPSAAVG